MSIRYAHAQLEADETSRRLVLSDNANNAALAKLVDHTLLKPDATTEKIDGLCAEASQHGFCSVCVPPAHVARAAENFSTITGNAPLVCTVIGFPLGYNVTSIKIAETGAAILEGAGEIDFVMNAAHAKQRNWTAFTQECSGIVAAAQGRLVKIILETSLLSEQEIHECSLHAALSGVHVIKTSTGFGGRGASVEDVSIIARALAEVEAKTGVRHGIKASGGVRNRSDALLLLKVGATRLGTSGGVAMMEAQLGTPSGALAGPKTGSGNPSTEY